MNLLNLLDIIFNLIVKLTHFIDCGGVWVGGSWKQAFKSAIVFWREARSKKQEARSEKLDSIY